MCKSITKRLKYMAQICTSMNRPDDVEPDVYLNIFKDGETLYGWREYDYFKNRDLKSNKIDLGTYYNIKFIPKDEIITYRKQSVQIVHRLKVV